MGDNFLRRQTANFRKGRDQSAVDINNPTLFSRPEVSSTIYSVRPIESFAIKDGETLFVTPSADSERAVVARGHVEVGVIDGDGAKVLLDALKSSGVGLAKVQITEVSVLSGMAKGVLAAG